MSPVGINGVDKQGVGVNGVQVKQVLSAANETVSKGVYDATTLSAVDADLIAENIEDGTIVFGIEGTLAAGILAEDITGSALTALVTDIAQAAQKESVTVPFGEDVDMATKTQTYDASSIAVAVGHCYWFTGDANVFKLRLYMDGVQVAESGYAVVGVTTAWQLIATRALSGSTICKIAVHSYHANTNKAGFLIAYAVGDIVPAGIGIGSIKLA